MSLSFFKKQFHINGHYKSPHPLNLTQNSQLRFQHKNVDTGLFFTKQELNTFHALVIRRQGLCFIGSIVQIITKSLVYLNIRVYFKRRVYFKKKDQDFLIVEMNVVAVISGLIILSL